MKRTARNCYISNIHAVDLMASEIFCQFFEWPFYTGFTVFLTYVLDIFQLPADLRICPSSIP